MCCHISYIIHEKHDGNIKFLLNYEKCFPFLSNTASIDQALRSFMRNFRLENSQIYTAIPAKSSHWIAR